MFQEARYRVIGSAVVPDFSNLACARAKCRLKGPEAFSANGQPSDGRTKPLPDPEASQRTIRQEASSFPPPRPPGSRQAAASLPCSIGLAECGHLVLRHLPHRLLCLNSRHSTRTGRVGLILDSGEFRLGIAKLAGQIIEPGT
jgi:hypothetical protein